MIERENTPRRKFTLNRRYFILCFFVLISLILWVTTKLTSEYSANLQFTPQIINSLTGGTYTDEHNNNTLYIQTKAKGYYIMRQQLTKNHTLSIDLKDKKIIPGKSSNLIKLPTAGIKDKVLDALGRDITIISIEPDTLYLRYSRPSTKRVPVKPNFKLLFEKEYQQIAPIVFEPDSITIMGQHEVLDTINAVYTINETYADLKETLETSLSIKSINKVVFSQRKVKFKVPIERCTESSIKLPISVLNPPHSYSILLLPPQVEVKYIVPLSDYTTIKKDDFEAVVDYFEVDSLSTTRKLRVKLLRTPQKITSVKLSPEFVDFIQHKE